MCGFEGSLPTVKKIFLHRPLSLHGSKSKFINPTILFHHFMKVVFAKEIRQLDMCKFYSSTWPNSSYYFHINPFIVFYAYKRSMYRYLIALIFAYMIYMRKWWNSTVELIKHVHEPCRLKCCWRKIFSTPWKILFPYIHMYVCVLCVSACICVCASFLRKIWQSDDTPS